MADQDVSAPTGHWYPDQLVRIRKHPRREGEGVSEISPHSIVPRVGSPAARGCL